MTPTRLKTDICVVGGGPAGATTAARLAAFGFNVTVLDSQRVAGKQTSASLPPDILPLIDVLGGRERLESCGFIRTTQIGVLWEKSRPELRERVGVPGFHVERARFDRLVLELAKSAGAQVLKPATAGPMHRNESGGWTIAVTGSPKAEEIQCQFVVDASGRRLRGDAKNLRLSPATVALTATWECPEATHEYGCVEAGKSEWLWLAPLSGHRAVASVFVDPARLRGKGIRDAVYHRAIVESHLISRSLRGGVMTGPISSCDASLRVVTPAADVDILRVGDSSLQLDPLSSQGVVSGIASALQAAVIINTILRRRQNAFAAIRFYSERQSEKAKQHSAKSADFYRRMLSIRDDPFWIERSKAARAPEKHDSRKEGLDLQCRIVLSEGTVLAKAPMITGDFVDVQPAVHHESLDQPVAFLNGVYLPPLLAKIDGKRAAKAILEEWVSGHSRDVCWEILRWLWQRKVIGPSDGAGAPG